MSTVLFWDIDGTLLTTARAGIFAWEDAVEEVCGVRMDLSDVRTAGLTDAQIALLLVERASAGSTPERAAEALRSYERRLPGALARRQGRVLPGVTDVLDDLGGREGVSSLLLTGNTREGAAAKLRHYGLDGYFNGGAFCREGDDRETIAREAWTLACSESSGNGRPSAFVIGDTPHDVRCGKAIGACTVALATGGYPVRELESCDPWLTLERLPEPAAFAELLGLRAPG